MEHYIPTGNEMVSLPLINELSAGIEDLTWLSMQHKGMIELHGAQDMPLILPFVSAAGRELPLDCMQWTREHYWLPKLRAKAGGHDFTMTILAPVGERGFAIRLQIKAAHDEEITWGLKGCWAGSRHCVNQDKPLEGSMHCYESGWNDGIVFDFRCGTPMFALAPMCDKATEHSFRISGGSVSYCIGRKDSLSPEQELEAVFYWGLGFEEVAAATGAKEMLRRGWAWEYSRTAKWLDERSHPMPTEKLSRIYNTNLFFCIFYSTGITMDTEELICATSRGTRYYVSAAYWDRDVLLWAFPAILDADRELAREILNYVFTRQRKNLGVHSRYIDGTVLEPGFELDELVCPIIALEAYVDKSGDLEILSDSNVLLGIKQILKTLSAMRHEQIPLYETFLQPTDDEIVYPYLTYNNALVWRSFMALARLLPDKYGPLAATAGELKSAIYEHCVFSDENGNSYFGWSVDLKGRHNVYDEPPGSLQLLPYYGFCSEDDAVWQNTVKIIRSPDYEYSFATYPIAEIGCAHAPYPWILSLANSLLCGYADKAFRELEIISMDNGIACESVDPISGECTTGAAFATCAGFLCHGMRLASQEGAYAK